MDCLFLTDDDVSPGKTPRILATAPQVPEGLAATTISPYAARLVWQAVGGASVRHYNVYCGTTAEFTPDQSTLVASPDEPFLIDWGLKPGSTLYYRVQCVDRFGRQSPACESISVKTPAIRRVLIEKRFSERIPFDAPAKDTYAVWLLLRKAGESHGYIDVACQRGGRARPTGTGTSQGPGAGPVAGGGAWFAALDGLSDATWLNYDQWGRLELDTGPHVLTLSNKTGSKVEKVIITNDLSYAPPGHVNILTGW